MANGVVSLLSASLRSPEGPLSAKTPPAESNSTGVNGTANRRGEGLDAPEAPATDELAASTWCASGWLAHDGVVCCDKTCGQCGGDNCASLPGGAEHCCLAVIESMAVACSSYTDTACLLPKGASEGGAQSSSDENATNAATANATEPPLPAKSPPAENSTTGAGDTIDPLDTGIGRDDEGGSDQASNASNATGPTTAEAVVAARAAEVAAARAASAWCASGWLAHDGVVCCDKTCGQCGGDNCASLPGGAEHCCLAVIESMAVACSSYTDTACLLPPARWLAQENISSAREYFEYHLPFVPYSRS